MTSVEPSWPGEVFLLFKEHRIRQVALVPDAGHTALIRRVMAEPEMRPVALTTEEEGVALAAGAWLGGDRSVLLMQSSGVGNCVNMLSLIANGRFPFLALVTMRGEWGEENGWQNPMGQATPAALALMGVHVLRADRAEDVAPVVEAGLRMAFAGGAAVAVLLSQRLIGAKSFVK
ncbi:MAG: thiamine pyrophosphate-binding protein [Hyphomicrobiaceae bacterium]